MNLLSSIFGNQPEWHRALPPHVQFTNVSLILDLERIRQQLELDHEMFEMVVLHSRPVMVRNLHTTYREAQRQLPGHSQADYFAMVIGDRITKKLMAHELNTSPSALSPDELERIIDDLESISRRFSTLDEVIRFLTDIEEREQRWNDPTGIMRRLDEVFSKHPNA